MAESSTCQYFQTGFCKFRENCRNIHEHTICKEQHDFKAVGCSFRHPKVCRSFKNDGSCKFKDECAYNHKRNKDDKSMTEDDLKVSTLHQEVAHLKAKISQLENNIEFLQQEIQKVAQINVSEIGAIVLSTQNGDKLSKHDAEAFENKEESVKCDICNFKA